MEWWDLKIRNNNFCSKGKEENSKVPHEFELPRIYIGPSWSAFVTSSWQDFATAAAAKSLQSFLCDPMDCNLPGSAALGFSRQEHWSGLPFPSPMHESEKWKWSHSVVSDSSRPHGLQPTRLLRQWDFPGKSTGVGWHCLFQTGPWRDAKNTQQKRSRSWTLSGWARGKRKETLWKKKNRILSGLEKLVESEMA